MSLFKRYYPVLVAVLVAVLPLGMNTYWTEVAVNVGLYALLALSLNVILGQAGIFHMGHAAFYAVGAYVTAILNTHYQIPILLLIPVAGAAAALFALIVARPIIHLRGDYLLIVTIGIVEIVRIALINDVFGLTGGANGIFGIARPELFGIKIRKAIQFYYLIWIMVGLTVLLFHWLSESRFGRALNCIKEDDTAAEGCGMDVAHLKLMAFVIGAFWAGMAGNLFAAKMTIISPSSFTFWESVVVFAVVILSGGSQIGVLLGTFLIVALPEMFRDFASARMLVFGLAMMIMMVVMVVAATCTSRSMLVMVVIMIMLVFLMLVIMMMFMLIMLVIMMMFMLLMVMIVIVVMMLFLMLSCNLNCLFDQLIERICMFHRIQDYLTVDVIPRCCDNCCFCIQFLYLFYAEF